MKLLLAENYNSFYRLQSTKVPMNIIADLLNTHTHTHTYKERHRRFKEKKERDRKNNICHTQKAKNKARQKENAC
jgi:hypothetical protein